MESQNRVLKFISFVFVGLFFGFFLRLLENRKGLRNSFFPTTTSGDLPILLESIEELSLLDEIQPHPFQEIDKTAETTVREAKVA